DSESVKTADSSSESKNPVESKGLRFVLGDIKIKNDVEEAVVPQICHSLISRHIWTEPTPWHNRHILSVPLTPSLCHLFHLQSNAVLAFGLFTPHPKTLASSSVFYFLFTQNSSPYL
ncbi:hypothetical protein MC885_015210, partial [Smutsia gigantea]